MKKIAIVYIIGGAGGSLLSCLFSDLIWIGGLGGDYAIFGGLLIKIMEIWCQNNESRNRREIFMIMLVLMMIVVLTVLTFPVNEGSYEVGSLVMGVALGGAMGFENQVGGRMGRFIKTVGICFVIAFFNARICLFFMFRKPGIKMMDANI